jgi:uridine kinase
MILGICGGTSGKTTVAERLAQALGRDQAILLAQDAYYKDSSHLPFDERVRQNFDHPDAVDFDLLIRHVDALRSHQPVQQPSYDFSAHVRRQETTRVDSRVIVIVEGILIFQNSGLRNLFDLKIFVDTDAGVRFIRRLRRDISERGRSLDSVVQQYLETVRPMHQEFVEPGRRFADIVIPEGGKNDAAMELLVQWLATKVQKFEAGQLVPGCGFFVRHSHESRDPAPDQEPIRFRGNDGP